MRNFCAVLLATAVLTGSAFADASLAPGKPAGAHQAQNENTTLWTVVGLGAVAGAVILVTSGSNDDKLVVAPPATVTTGTP